jgi:hypothetical protein
LPQSSEPLSERDLSVERLTARIVDRAQVIADSAGLDAQTKMAQLIASINIAQTPEGGVIDELHIPANAQLHHRTLVETVRRVAPVMAQVVEQGIAEGVYATPNPLESVEFLLAGISVVFDEGFFALVPEQMASRAVEVVRVAELVLGARPGSFSFLVAGAGGQP